MADRRTSTAIRFDPELHERLSAAAHDREVSLNWLVTRLCSEGLERMLPATSMRVTEPGAT